MAKRNQAEVQAEENEAQQSVYRRVAICGTAETLKDAPFDDKDFTIWGTGTCIGHDEFTRGDMVFEMHTKDRWIHRAAHINNYGCSVMMQKKVPEVKKSIEFPKDELVTKYPWIKWEDQIYVTNTISWMIIYAIDQGFDAIHLYGVHFACEHEWSYERPNLEYYCGVARGGYGIDIYTPPGAEILKGKRVYGYENPQGNRMIMEQRLRNFEQDRIEMAEKEQQARDAKQQYIGAINVTKMWRKYFYDR